eukprot:894074-Pelagomonas_calceolata.AAC.4
MRSPDPGTLHTSKLTRKGPALGQPAAAAPYSPLRATVLLQWREGGLACKHAGAAGCWPCPIPAAAAVPYVCEQAHAGQLRSVDAGGHMQGLAFGALRYAQGL